MALEKNQKEFGYSFFSPCIYLILSSTDCYKDLCQKGKKALNSREDQKVLAVVPRLTNDNFQWTLIIVVKTQTPQNNKTTHGFMMERFMIT